MTTLILDAARYLNTPVVKEGIKNVAGSLTCAFGLYEAYDLYQISQGRPIADADPDVPQWCQAANKVAILSGKISLVLSAGVSRPGVYIISTLVGTLFTTAQLERVFGPNTIFAINPSHPRHVVSIIAVVLALPAVVQLLYKGYLFATNELHSNPEASSGMALYNTIFSRPLLHILNPRLVV